MDCFSPPNKCWDSVLKQAGTVSLHSLLNLTFIAILLSRTAG
jgi:hypothetical protein